MKTDPPSPCCSRREFVRSAAALAGVAVARATGAAPAASRSPYLLGAYTRPWDKWDYRVALDGIAEAGFRKAGIMTAKGRSWVMVTVESTPEEVETLDGELRQRGLEALSLYGGDFPVAQSVAAGIAGLRKLVDHAARCGCPNLLLGGTSDPGLHDAYYEVVRECCDYAVARGVGLSIKPHGGTNATGPQCRQLVRTVGHPNFRIWYDPGNIFYYSDGALDPVHDATTVDGLVVGMSVKDFRPPKEVLVTPGDGRVDFGRVLTNLRRGGFVRGPLLIECLAPGATPAQVTAEARRARRFLESVLAELDEA